MPEAQVEPEAIATQLVMGLSLGHRIMEAMAPPEAVIMAAAAAAGPEAPGTEEPEPLATTAATAELMEALQLETEVMEEEMQLALTG